MQPFTLLHGPAAPMWKANIDTDQIIPKQYLSTIERVGLGKGLFHDQRWLEDGGENPAFVLNNPAYKGTQILIAGANFGCGSSREHAPWALLDFGVRCIIAPSFSVIFQGNCINNGILPARVDEADAEALAQEADGRRFTIDLAAQSILAPSGRRVLFSIDETQKHKLLHGVDDIASTLQRRSEIENYEARLPGWMGAC